MGTALRIIRHDKPVTILTSPADAGMNLGEVQLLALKAYVEMLRLKNYSYHTIKNYTNWFIFFLIISLSKISEAQWVMIPDTNFVAWLNTYGFSQCMNGNLMDTTCSSIIGATNIGCPSANIADLNGIQYFDSLLYLQCNYNPLTSLPPLPEMLLTLNCGNNLLTSLPLLNNSLNWLSCSNNQLTTLPPLPMSLSGLACENNQLNTLPALPPNLLYIWASFNSLDSLPVLPVSLIFLLCNDNELTSLPELPPYLNQLWIHNNPDLICLPWLTTIDSLVFYNTGVACWSNQGNVFYSNPPLNSIPSCWSTNPNSCDLYGHITGSAFIDVNADCSDDTSAMIKNLRIDLWKNGVISQQTFTDQYGAYQFYNILFDSLEIKVDTTATPFVITCPDSLYHEAYLTMTDSLDPENNFGLECQQGYDLAPWSVFGIAFVPGNYTTVKIGAGDYSNFFGVNCATGTSGSVKTLMTGNASYISPAPGALTPTVSNDTLIYLINDFGTVNSNSDFNIIVQTETTAQAGDDICFTVIVDPIAGDNNPSNNILTHCFEVVNGYDPNMKEVYPSGDILEDQEWLTYTIRFQNTGTAPAQHIYLLDTLDTDLEVSSFQLLAYSHENITQIFENGIVKFNFPNINLPDSTSNEPESHGYAQYRIKLKDNLPLGTEIENTASIYFDFNTPVVTNTVSNVITEPDFVPPINMDTETLLYPNPSTDQLTISSSQKISSITVHDLLGKEIFKQENILSVNCTVLTVNWSPGVYFVRIKTEEGELVKKVVKE